jgi:hypothetical protein
VSTPDAELIALCLEHVAVVELINNGSLDDDEPACQAACERDSALCAAIARIRPETPLGLAHKARIVAQENGLGPYLDGRSVEPLKNDADLLLLALMSDLIQGRSLR